MVFIISIEGNIGSGKSTFVNLLKENCKDRDDICFLQEPVDQWLQIKDNEGNILQHYYKDQQKYSFAFQMMAYISRLSLLREAMQNKQYKFIITERSLFTDKEVFCKMLYDDKFINEIEYQIYNKWFYEFDNWLSDFDPKFIFIYFQCDPTISYERVKLRARIEETIPLEYLVNCHDYHEKWLTMQDKIIIDATPDIRLNPSILNDWFTIVKLFL